MMNIKSKAFLATGVMLVAALVAGIATPASASPGDLPFSVVTENFQATNGDPLLPEGGGLVAFGGGPTSIPLSGVTVDATISTSVHLEPFPTVVLVEGGLNFLTLTFFADDGLFVSADPSSPGGFFASGVGGGSDIRSTGITFLTLYSDGSPVPLDPASAFPSGPVIVNPSTGEPAIFFDTAGDDVDTFGLLGSTPLAVLFTAVIDPASGLTGLDVDGFSIAVEVIPEPASLALLGMGLCSTLLIRRRKR